MKTKFRKFPPLLAGATILLIAVLMLCAWRGDAKGAEHVDYCGNLVYFYTKAIPQKLHPSTLIASYQAGHWNGNDLKAKGVTVAICGYGTLCYRLECQRANGDGSCRHNSTWSIVIPVYPDIPVGQQSTLIAEGDAACTDIVKLIDAFDNNCEKDPYEEHTTRYATKSLVVFGENGFELYCRGNLLDSLPVKNAEKVNVFSHQVDGAWRSDFIVYAEGCRYYAYDDGQKLIVDIAENVVFHDRQNDYYATFVNDKLQAHYFISGIPGKFITGVTEAKTVYVHRADQNTRTIRYLAYVKDGQMWMTDFISKIWREGVPCGRKVPYQTVAELETAINSGDVIYADNHLVVAGE